MEVSLLVGVGTVKGRSMRAARSWAPPFAWTVFRRASAMEGGVKSLYWRQAVNGEWCTIVNALRRTIIKTFNDLQILVVSHL
jgi:hypothetical protein